MMGNGLAQQQLNSQANFKNAKGINDLVGRSSALQLNSSGIGHQIVQNQNIQTPD
jgi:hypothetical protein|tara:strand:+ start:454 stop:618 length:165 start_codon:yes stop_codon:yes gene_type:complete